MKFCQFCDNDQKSEKDGIQKQKQRKGIFLVILLCFLAAFWEPCPWTCQAASQESLPAPEIDKVFGPRCPPGMCVIPQGFLLSRRDKAFGVHFAGDKKGWVVGDNGLALMTPDGGRSWQRVVISDETFNDVIFVGEKGWIVGGSGLILHTNDGGKNWEKQPSNVSQSLMRVLFFDEDKGFTIGTDGIILKTLNGGSSWENASLDCMALLPPEMMEIGIISINLYDILFTDESNGWIVGDSGAVLHSEDGGKEWKLVNMGPYPPLFSIAFKNDREGWAVGQNGFSLKTEDGGKTWGKVVIEKENSLYKIRIHNGYGVIVGDQATVIETYDGGKTWDKVATDLHPPYPWLADAWILPSNSAKVLSVGKGVILETKISSKK
jgi:photosystem II stability/assembly factor-like uncharacterized protein